MNRRQLLAGSAAAIALALARRGSGAGGDHSGAVRISVDTSRSLGAIPEDFLGLGYEISSVSQTGLLSAQNQVYVQLLRTLGSNGVIRIGGNTSDYSSFDAEGQAISAPKGTVVNPAGLHQLRTFLEATGWKLIWGLNLGGANEQQAVEESQAVAAAIQDKLLAFEIGNEPDLFGSGAAHRPSPYSYDDYLKEFRRYKAAVRVKLPNAQFAGPDAAVATDWVTRFSGDEGNDLKLLTHHYYRECSNPTSTLHKLLYPDPKLAPELAKLRGASAASHVPYRMCETNSFCGGGMPGISDTFGAALWVLDFMWTLAYAGCAGVNIETGVNQLGFVSSYSPVGDDLHGTYLAKPEYYGMLAFAQASLGQRVTVVCDAAGVNLTAYAVVDDQRRLLISIINKDESRDADVSISATGHLTAAHVLRLTAPSLQSKGEIKLGGSAVDAQGQWTSSIQEAIRSKRGVLEIRVPAASAALVVRES